MARQNVFGQQSALVFGHGQQSAFHQQNSNNASPASTLTTRKPTCHQPARSPNAPSHSGRMPTGDQAGPDGTPPKVLHFQLGSWAAVPAYVAFSHASLRMALYGAGPMRDGRGAWLWSSLVPMPPRVDFATRLLHCPRKIVFPFCPPAPPVFFASGKCGRSKSDRPRCLSAERPSTSPDTPMAPFKIGV